MKTTTTNARTVGRDHFASDRPAPTERQSKAADSLPGPAAPHEDDDTVTFDDGAGFAP